MKKLLLLLLVFFAVITCNAQIHLERNQGGKYRADKEDWDKSDITADTLSMDYSEYFTEAIENPNMPVLVGENEVLIELRLIFKKLVKIQRMEIIYSNLDKNISSIESIGEEKEEFSKLSLMLAISIFLVLLSNIFLWLYSLSNNSFIFLFSLLFVVFAAVINVVAGYAALPSADYFIFISSVTIFFAAGAIFNYSRYRLSSNQKSC
jgi:hypothetical protein